MTKPLAPWASTAWRVFSWLSAESTMIGTGGDGHFLLVAADGGDRVQPVHDRHVQIHQHHVEALFAAGAGHRLDRGPAVADDFRPDARPSAAWPAPAWH